MGYGGSLPNIPAILNARSCSLSNLHYWEEKKLNLYGFRKREVASRELVNSVLYSQ
jgi:hypothetical protein